MKQTERIEWITVPLLLGVLLLLPAGCCNKPGSDPAAEMKRADSLATVAEHFYLPDVPTMMIDPAEQLAFLAINYWNYYAFTDTAFVQSTSTEQLFVDFIDVLHRIHNDSETATTAVQTMLMQAEQDTVACKRFRKLCEHYFYDPNSPMRSEDYYLAAVNQILESEQISLVEKIRYTDRLKQMQKNRPGMVATDFSFVTGDGETHYLNDTKADYLLLFFYDPDCLNCKETKQALLRSQVVRVLQAAGRLRVVAIYPDEDATQWKRHLVDMPSDWIVGHDSRQRIRNKQLYDLRALPTFYLLDRDKRVALKDVLPGYIEYYLQKKESE